MVVGEIYTTFMGECNPYGIGAPAIFLRLSGCPLRCYKKTLGTLCDTPLFLARKTGIDMPIDFLDSMHEAYINQKSIADEMAAIRLQTGIKLICLTGGDPLWQDPEDLTKLFKAVSGFKVCVETSGCLNPAPFLKHEHVSFILDYKLLSTGEGAKNKHNEYNHLLRPHDFLKFVIYDEQDFQEMLKVLATEQFTRTRARISAGVFWGGKMDTFELFRKLEEQALLGRVSINMQAHKLVIAADPKKIIPEKI